MKIIFMGTPDFSIPVLDTIVNSGHNLIAIITQPDKPKGRGKQMSAPAAKVWGEKRGIPVYQPVKVREPEFMTLVRELAPDLIVTAAYGQILPKDFLKIPFLGCINVHASLLPFYRGASPIQQALLDGQEKTGITIMYMDEGMDTGDIIHMEELQIMPDENSGQLHDRLSELGGEVLAKALLLFEAGPPVGAPQDNEKATYCSKIDKAMGEIDWDQPPVTIKNLVRGLTPWPGAFTYANGQRIKVWKCDVWEYFTQKECLPGTVMQADSRDGLIVSCKYGALQIIMMQGEGGKQLDSTVYLRGNPIVEGTILGK